MSVNTPQRFTLGEVVLDQKDVHFEQRVFAFEAKARSALKETQANRFLIVKRDLGANRIKLIAFPVYLPPTAPNTEPATDPVTHERRSPARPQRQPPPERRPPPRSRTGLRRS